MPDVETPTEFVERARKGEFVYLAPKSFKEFPDEDAEHLAEFLPTWFTEQSSMCFENVAFSDKGWGTVLEALVSNPRLNTWGFSRGTRLPDAVLESLPKHLAAAKQVKRSFFEGIELTPAVMEGLAVAALDREEVEELGLVTVHPVQPTEKCLEALARLVQKWPVVLPSLGSAPHGESLPFLVAMKAIKNKQVMEEVKVLQAELLKDMASKDDVTDFVKKETKLRGIGKGEETRLLGLLAPVMDKYSSSTLGGVVLQGLLPPACDEYGYRGELTQQMPKAFKSKEDQIRWQLSNAIQQRPRLQEIIDGVMADVGPLMHLHSHETYFLEALIDAVLRQHGLLELVVTVPAYKVAIPGAEQSGVYTYFRHNEGRPAYKRTGDEGSECYLYYTGSCGCFVISKICTSADKGNWDFLILRSPEEGGDWLSMPDATPVEGVVVEKFTTEVKLRDELLAFMVKKTQPEFQRLLDVGDALVQELRGPPKALARALEKDPCYLLDLNRWTFKVDCFTIMVLVFLFIKKRVEAAEGRISRFDNFHLENTPEAWDFAKTGGLLQRENLKRPPCLHLNIVVEGWSAEIMILLSDFALVKEQLHKFYDVTRAPDLAALLNPVFPPEVPQAAAASREPISKDSAQMSSKLDQVLDVVLKGHRKMELQLEAQTQAAEEAKETQKRVEAQLEEAKEAQKRVEAKLEEALKKLEEATKGPTRDQKLAEAAEPEASNGAPSPAAGTEAPGKLKSKLQEQIRLAKEMEELVGSMGQEMEARLCRGPEIPGPAASSAMTGPPSASRSSPAFL